MGPDVLFFDDPEAEQPAISGGKAVNLARLARAGLAVPPGFVVTTGAFRRRGEEGVAAAILEAYRRLGAGPAAVRSSATTEDLEGASFAGQQETILGVDGEPALLAAVRRCWDSLFSERAIAYRRAQGIPEAQAAMAVIVQRLVDAEAAGVLFTRDPTQPGSQRMLVEAAWGLGEAVVSGRVTPDRWTLDRETGAVLAARAARKAIMIAPAGEREVPAARQDAPCLREEDLRALAELGRRVEAEYGAPQDVEWAMAGGRLFLLQSRPVTAAAGDREVLRREEIERLRARADPDGTVWARYSLAEVLPEPLPLTWGYWRRFMSGGGGYGRMYRELGYDPDPCLESDGILDLIAGRPYFNLSRDAKLYFAGFPNDYPFAKLKANPELALYPRPETNLARAPKGFLFRLPGLTRRMLAAEKRLERAAEELPGELERTWFPRIAAFAAEARAADLSRLSPAELAERARACAARIFDEFAPRTLMPSVLAGLAIQKLEQELKPAPGAAPPPVEALLAGAAPDPAWDLARGLRDLARGELDPAAFREQFGHRGPGEMELANPRWRELPPPAGGAAIAAGEPAPPPAVKEIAPGGGARGRAPLYLERARRFTALREAGKHHLMLAYEVLRLVLVEMDRRLDLDGGIFYLEPEELPAAAAGEEMRPRIAARRRRRSLALGLEAPRVLFSDDLEALGRPAPPPPAGAALEGTGVSPGAAEGPALVLHSPSQAPPDAREFILVCPSTDPGWVPLFLRARGLVLETGGILSHGAIVAREFGLPAVAGLEDACSRLRSGQRLRVDGSAGRVVLVDGDA